LTPFAKLSIPNFTGRKFKPIEAALLVAIFGCDGWVAADNQRAATRVLYTAKRYLAAWLGFAFYEHERRSFSDGLLFDKIQRLYTENRLLEHFARIPGAAGLTPVGRLAALAIKEALDPPFTPEQFDNGRVNARIKRTGRFAA
jgi:hypothetical protein